jgi:hypothetical protein
VPFSVAAEPDVETLVIDSSFRLVYKGIGSFSHAVPAGLYKFKFRRGGSWLEKNVELPSDVPIAPDAEFSTSSAVPLRKTRGASERHFRAAQDLSQQTHESIGVGCRIFLFSRVNPSRPANRDAALGLTLRTLDAATIVDFGAKAIRDDPSGMSCAGYTVEVNPGSYILRDESGPEALEMIVCASPGWQTQVFLLVEGASEGDAPPQTLTSAAVVMSRGGFDPESEMLRLADSARIALSESQVTMPRKLLEDLLDDNFENPMLGLYAAQAILAGGDDALLSRVINTLDRLVPGHPDLLALHAFRDQTTVTIPTPPMLLSSWKLTVDACAKGTALLPPRSLVSRIPAALFTGTPWLVWSPNALLTEDDTEARDVTIDLAEVQKIVATLADSFDVDDLGIELSPAEDELLRYLSRRARLQRIPTKRAMSRSESFDERELAQMLSTTLAQTQRAISGLAAKLRQLANNVAQAPPVLEAGA